VAQLGRVGVRGYGGGKDRQQPPRLRRRGSEVAFEARRRIAADRRLRSLAPGERAPDDFLAVAGPPQLLGGCETHLLSRTHSARGEQDQEPDAVGSRRRHRADPAALADSPDAELGDTERVADRDRVVGLQGEVPARRSAGRITVATAIEGRDPDTGCCR
jgi:hypothetical protein